MTNWNIREPAETDLAVPVVERTAVVAVVASDLAVALTVVTVVALTVVTVVAEDGDARSRDWISDTGIDRYSGDGTLEGRLRT
jgi:hypothetical protein